MSREDDGADGAAALRAGGGFPSRLVMDVVAAQLPATEDMRMALPARAASASPPASEAAEDGEWRSLPSGDPSSRPTTGLPLDVIAKAEMALEKPVTIAHGGTHVAFSHEDIHRIRDPTVLRFMEENSSLFSRYLQERKAVDEEDGTAASASAVPERTTAAEVEANILRLQQEIDTFITAVDEDGRNYRILANEEGNVVLPVSDAIHDAETDADTEWSEAPAEADVTHSSLSGAAAAGLAALNVEWQELPQAGGSPARCGAFIEESEKNATRGQQRTSPPLPLAEERPAKTGKLRPSSIRGAAPVPSSAAASGPARRPTQPAKPRGKAAKPALLAGPARSVRPVRALRPEEEERVERLLHDRSLGVAEPSPFDFPEDAAKRLAAIDERLSTLRVARGAQRTFHDDEREDGSSGAPAASEPSAGSTQGSSTARAPPLPLTQRQLGDAYMHESRAAAQHRRRLQQVNAELLRLHHEEEALALLADEAASSALPADVRAMRPAWANAAAAAARLPDDDAVAAMLQEAAEEQRRCTLLGLSSDRSPADPATGFTGTTADPYASLRAALQAARGRAEELLRAESQTGAAQEADAAEARDVK